MFNNTLAVFLGGGFGSLARYGVSKLVPLFIPGSFPFGVLIANSLSCILVGIISTVGFSKPFSDIYFRHLLIIGFCGGFSTFSAFSFDTVELVRIGNYFYATLNIIFNLMLSFASIVFGIFLSSKIFSSFF